MASGIDLEPNANVCVIRTSRDPEDTDVQGTTVGTGLGSLASARTDWCDRADPARTPWMNGISKCFT